MLSTPWSRAMGLRVPIVNVPMGGVAGGRLAAGVSAAGGLGMVGMATAGSTSSLHAELPHVTGTFGSCLVDWVMRKEVGLFEAALAAQPVCRSFEQRQGERRGRRTVVAPRTHCMGGTPTNCGRPWWRYLRGMNSPNTTVPDRHHCRSCKDMCTSPPVTMRGMARPATTWSSLRNGIPYRQSTIRWSC